MKRIAIFTIADISNYNPERLTYHLGSFLSEKFQVDLVGAEKISQRIQNNFPIYTRFSRLIVPTPFRQFLSFFIIFANGFSYIRRKQPDLLMELGDIGLPGLAVTLLGKIFHRPTIVRITSDIFHLYTYQENFGRKIKMFLKHRIVGSITLRLADQIIVLGPRMKQNLVKRHFPSEKIHILPQPVTLNKDVTEQDIRKEYNIKESTYLILFVGRFTKEKGAHTLAQTIKQVIGLKTDTCFLLVGSGLYQSQMEKMFSNEPLVIFAGHISHHQLTPFYQSADLFLNTSNTEGLPTVVLEALYYNCPVVATDSGGEVTQYISNINKTSEAISRTILSRQYTLDPLPQQVLPMNNKILLQKIVEKTLPNQYENLDC